MAFYRCIPYRSGGLDRARGNQRCSHTRSVPYQEAEGMTKQLPHTPTGNTRNHCGYGSIRFQFAPPTSYSGYRPRKPPKTHGTKESQWTTAKMVNAHQSL